MDSFVFDADGEFSGVEEFADSGIKFFADEVGGFLNAGTLGGEAHAEHGENEDGEDAEEEGGGDECEFRGWEEFPVCRPVEEGDPPGFDVGIVN